MIQRHQKGFRGQSVFIGPDWTPDPDHLNALPPPLKNFIHRLATDTDPAETIRENVLIRDENEALRLKLAELQGTPRNRSRYGQRKGTRPMADNKSKTGKQDRNKVAGGQGYEVSYFARKHGISTDQARSLINRVGNDRDKLNAAAQKLK